MDTKEVAEKIGTTPRQLRAFLRSNHSTFQAVGSGARYDFTERELPTIAKRFGEWKAQGRPSASPTTAAASPKVRRSGPSPSERDRRVWAEEGPVVIEDIRDPRVRAKVRADAAAAENRLALLLIANQRHLMQAPAKIARKAS